MTVNLFFNGRMIAVPGAFVNKEIEIKPLGRLEAIAYQYGVGLTQVTDEQHELCKANGAYTYREISYVVGRYEIVLGIYDDEELKNISFFHELGHTLTPQPESLTIYQMEEEAWRLGIQLAKRYGFTFSKKALQWAKEKLETYKGSEEGAKQC